MRAWTRIALGTSSCLWLLAAVGYTSRPAPPDPIPTPDQAAFFETKIRPVLAENCLRCHGPASQQSGLRLDSLAFVKKGGDSGPALVSGDPDKSLIIQAVRQSGDLKMPPGGQKLSPSEIQDLAAWVKMGAPWPAATAAQIAAARPLWSLTPVTKPAFPKVHYGAWVRTPIDVFVLANLEAHHQKPSRRADRRTLIRRVTYDLTGLPPTPEDTQAFLADASPNAYAKVVDRLLASPQYGERQARHWMDIARYADTKGYVFNQDRNYPNAYTYRDWLIQAFNEDLPYDQFIVDQIAADHLPQVESGQDRRPLAAMGFLTLGRRFLDEQPSIIDDRIDVTMRGLEGFTVGCARCHDHKFDPIPTQDYYSLYGVFASSDEKLLPISPDDITKPWQEYHKQVTALEDQIHALISGQMKKLRDQKPETLPQSVRNVLQALKPEDLPSEGQLKQVMDAFEANERDDLNRLHSTLEALKAKPPVSPEFAMAMTDSPHPSDGVVFHHGNPSNPGIAAPRRFLLALSKPGVDRDHWTRGSGRWELANAIASKDNPLTARVFVNRVWQDHFGAGIVRTPSDFGHQGEKPTDPKLLDYLASAFMDHGWSVKDLNRLIVTSATYCQSSDVTPAAFDADPDNRNWGRMNRRRLDLEQMHDAMLAAAGNLQTDKIGGRSVDLWATPFPPRRAVYGFVERQNLPGIFRTFDFASPDTTSARRFQTTVPQQALFFLNSEFAIAAARSVSERPEIANARDDVERVNRLYRVLFDRAPDDAELMTGLQYLDHSGAATAPPPIWQYGFGGYDADAERDQFTPFAHFDEGRYHPESAFPDGQLGYLTLGARNGHPGRDASHAVIRRWTSPMTGTVTIEGELIHGQPQGDGVRGRIVSDRGGLLGEWEAHNSRASTRVPSVNVIAGETIDFAVDCIANDGFDSFEWSPTIRAIKGGQAWNAADGFRGPPGKPLSRLTLYTQALMMTNEFMFID